MSRILWFHPRPWGPPQGGGDLRTQGLVQCALRTGHEVAMIAPSATGHHPVPTGLRLIGFPGPGAMRLPLAKALSVHPLRSPRLTATDRRALRRDIESFAPEVAIVSEVMSWSIAHALLPDGISTVYDAANVESVLFRGLAAQAAGLDRITFGVDAWRVARAEKALLDRADVVVAVSVQEREALAEMAPGVRVEVVPSSVETPPRQWTRSNSGPTVLFVGTLDYPPNVDAVAELVATVLPTLRRTVPRARLVIVGRKPTPAVRELTRTSPGVELHENVPDLEPFYLGARCAVLPIRTGGGTKLKVYEALSYGIPVVATPSALSGVPVAQGSEALVAEKAEALADLAARLFEDDDLAAELGRAGRLAFDSRLSWKRAAQQPLDRVIRELAAKG